MKKEEILTVVQEIFREVLDDDGLMVGLKTTAADVEDWDSLAHINLVVSIEKEFKVKFALGELQELKNVGDMIDLIFKKII